jgi:hypothetical protein
MARRDLRQARREITAELTARVRELRRHITDEVIKILGLHPSVWTRTVLAPVLSLPTRRFSEIAAEFDLRISQTGLPEAARWALDQFRTRVDVAFQDLVPPEGPLLVASNHPGTVDGLAIAASLRRADLKIIASGLPFLRGMPRAADHLIYTPHPDQTHGRMAVVRSAIRHLGEGGSLLIFPSGQLDPDPAVLPGADQALRNWSPSIGVMLRAHPETRVMVSIVSGALSASNWRNPLTQIREGLRERQLMAEFIQIMRQILQLRAESLTTRLSLHRAQAVEQLASLRQDAHELTLAIESFAEGVLAEHLRAGKPQDVAPAG